MYPDGSLGRGRRYPGLGNGISEIPRKREEDTVTVYGAPCNRECRGLILRSGRTWNFSARSDHGLQRIHGAEVKTQEFRVRSRAPEDEAALFT